ncbi:MAG: amidohydrolase family protein [Deltaproteobacteria bacterium]|nr:amidohydrolase family protein [Deltaproteobacteria bacterium]
MNWGFVTAMKIRGFMGHFRSAAHLSGLVLPRFSRIFAGVRIMRETILSLLLCLLFLSPVLAAAQLLPIIDLHFHFAKGFDIDAFVKQMDTLGVAKVGNGARGAPDALALDWARRYPDRFIPFAGKEAMWGFIQSDGERAWRLQAPAVVAYLQKLEAALRAGQFKGIGEINNDADPDFPADSPLMQRLWSLSAAYRVPFNVHMDAREERVAEMERLLASDRRGTWLWAHAGSAGPALVRRLLRAHPNLWVELSGRAFDIMGDAEWKVLLEEFSDRFVLGTDTPNLQQFVLKIGQWRQVLKQLSPGTASKVAHQNAERLLNPGR